MYTKIAWQRSRTYSIYPQKHRRYGWLLIALLPALAAGWFVLPRHSSAHAALTESKTTVQSVALTKNEQLTTPQLPDASAADAQPLGTTDYAELRQLVNAWVKRQPTATQWSVVAQDLNNDANRVEVNPRATFYTASLYKLFLTIPLSQKYRFERWQTEHTLQDTGNHTIAECVDAMISKSDNFCGEAIGDTVGWVPTTKVVRSQGMTDTSLSSADLKTSARDVTTFLVGLERGKWFDPVTKRFLENSLGHQAYRAGIPAGCRDCTVLNKTGDLNGVRHDAAIVTHGDAHYVLVIMSSGGSNTQIADLSKLVASKLH